MRGGFRRLIHPGTPVNQNDSEGTRVERKRIHAPIRRRQHEIERLLQVVVADEGRDRSEGDP